MCHILRLVEIKLVDAPMQGCYIMTQYVGICMSEAESIDFVNAASRLHLMPMCGKLQLSRNNYRLIHSERNTLKWS